MRATQPQFGLGLRPNHYHAILESQPDLDFFEIISENYLLAGGKPMAMLDQIRADYPIVMHGVSLSIGAPAPLDDAYLTALETLIERVEPLWVSDHLCWTGAHGHNLHDLLPLPYTEDSLTHIVSKVQQVQDRLKRPLVLENPSTYFEFACNTLSEIDFIRTLQQRTGCELLLDINNVYVSSVNHGWSAWDYLQQVPVQAIRQIHLAGYTDHGDHLIDTHDHPVSAPVWALYARCVSAWQAAGKSIPTLLERDDAIPPLPDLLNELAQARAITQTAGAAADTGVVSASRQPPYAANITSSAQTQTA
ncbi:DUF692 domain-containing protein [Parvibium lacunae]|uniref:MNIO family bufferin maturase n=1 Tax=Parvibium lacunae TaxID=1888893 RepID=UPI001EFDFA4F|nr:DUF692 domain-containing protein [Parvibium lacunae]